MDTQSLRARPDSDCTTVKFTHCAGRHQPGLADSVRVCGTYTQWYQHHATHSRS